MVRNGFKKIIYKNMKYVKMFENFEVNKEWQDASKEERDTISIPSYKGTQAYKDIMGEDDIDFIITKIKDNFPKDDNVECVNCYGNIYDKEGYLILTYRFYSADILQINGVSIKVAVLGYDETEFKNTVRKPTYAILSCKNNNLLQIDVY